MNRLVSFAYGLICYAVFLGTFLYLIAFVGGFGVPRTVDAGGPEGSRAAAVAIDLLLIALFGLQHSIMARPAFKRWWTRLVPRPVERSTFVLFASALLCLLFWQWRPIPGAIWSIEQPALAGLLWGAFWLGWALVLVSTFLVDHFDLFGLRQVWLHLRGREYTHIGFRSPLLYKVVRHPLMLGFLIAFWATPHMTAGHLLFAVGLAVYILIAIRIEERDLVSFFGERYVEYRRRVRALVPVPRRSGR